MSSLSKTKNLDDVKIEDILSKVHEYIEDEEQVKVIERAYSFALKKHTKNVQSTFAECYLCTATSRERYDKVQSTFHCIMLQNCVIMKATNQTCNIWQV